VTRRERIVVLLDNYVDVEAGLRDLKGESEHIPLMCRAWNHPSYRELDRLLGVMKDERHHLDWHLSNTYFHAPRRQVKMCPRCRAVMPSWHSANFHKHGHSNVAVVPRVVRVVDTRVQDERVEEAVGWLEAEWKGEPYVPDDLLPLVISA
jgi:hypothetical protein